jgi:hypothetical protein
LCCIEAKIAQLKTQFLQRLLTYKTYTMENYNEPIDEQVTNEDNSITNKDGDNMLEQEEGANVQNKPDEVRVPTVTPGSEDMDPADEVVEEGDSKDETGVSNKGQGPKGENL